MLTLTLIMPYRMVGIYVNDFQSKLAKWTRIAKLKVFKIELIKV